MPPIAAALAAGIEAFNRRAFFDAHEHWEEAWHACAPGERDFYQGLVHATAACLHHERGNGHGFQRQVEKLRRRLTPFAPRHLDLDVARLLRDIAALPAPGAPATYPRIG